MVRSKDSERLVLTTMLDADIVTGPPEEVKVMTGVAAVKCVLTPVITTPG
jgi:hypothetical protein